MKFKSQVLTQASGSIGGITYSHNKGGMYQRARAKPTNPNTSRQQAVRAAFGGMVQMWNALTDEQRAAWNLYAANVPVLDKLGDMIHLSGQQWQIAVNSLRDGVTALGMGLDPAPVLAPIVNAPTTFNTGEAVLALTSATLDTATFAMSLDLNAPASDDGDALLFVGRPQNAGVKFYKGPYQLALVQSIASTNTSVQFSATDVTDPTDWASDYVPTLSTWMPYRVRIAYDDGRISQPFEDFFTPVAPE